MSGVTKLYLDSRYTVGGNGKTFDLQNAGLLLNPATRCWLSEFSCVASWDTVDATNNQLRVVENGTPRIIQIPLGAHDIDSVIAALEVALNTGAPVGVGTYSIQKVSTGASGSTYRSIEITLDAGTFAIPIDAANTSVSFLKWPNGYAAASSQKSSFVDMRRVHSIYIHSPGFGSYGSIGCRGSRNILAKIPVLAGYGSIVHFQSSGSEHDCIEVGTSALTTLQLELRDPAGNEMNLQGTSWSCTLIFER